MSRIAYRCDSIDLCFEFAQRKEGRAVAVSKLQFMSSKWVSKFYCIRASEHSSISPISMFIRNDLVLSKNISQIIRRSVEAGLIEQWKTNFQLNANPETYEALKQVSMEDLASGFVVIFGMLFLSILVLLLEMVIFRKSQEKKRFWMKFSRFVDAERYIIYWKPNE